MATNRFLMATLGIGALVVLTVVADYFLKVASRHEKPITTQSFLIGLLLYSSTAFVTVYAMKHVKLATIGAIYSVSVILLLALLGVLIFGETLDRYEVGGIVLAAIAILMFTKFV